MCVDLDLEGVSIKERNKAHCIPIFYELFAKDPEVWIKRIFRFLEIPFHPDILRYYELIGKPGGIVLSK